MNAGHARREALRERIMMEIVRRFGKSELGATAVEYALMCMCIVLVIIVSVAAVGTQLNGMYSEIPGYLK